MQDSYTDHPSDDLLEQYSLNRLGGSDLTLVEEHLLVCHECQDRLTEIDKFVRAMRDGLKEHNDENDSPAR